MRWHGYTYVDLAWRHEYCGLFSLEYRGVVWYFLDNERYFRRGALYGQMDDGERFAFFSKAVVSVLPMLEWRPEVIHCNDWQTALVPIYLKTVAENVSTVFTIHNIEYQGKYGADTVEDLFGLNRGDWYESGVLQMDGCVNLMKGAMVTADAVTTVSPTYAAQLRESAYAAGLDSVVRSIQWKFSGVLNGIDMVSYDPECDPNLPARYTAAEPEGKTLCKAALQQELGLAQEEGTPVLSMVTRLVGHKGVDLVCQALDGIMATGCQLVVLGSGDGGYENFFRHAQNRYPGRLCAWIGYNEGLSRRIYAGSDLFLMPSKSEPCGLSQMIAMRYGAVPIDRRSQRHRPVLSGGAARRQRLCLCRLRRRGHAGYHRAGGGPVPRRCRGLPHGAAAGHGGRFQLGSQRRGLPEYLWKAAGAVSPGCNTGGYL